MDLSLLKFLASLAAVLALASCASVSKTTAVPTTQSLESASQIGEAAQGALVQLPAGNSLDLDSVIVERTYFAASGRECRRLLDASGNPIQRVACKDQNGLWHFARNLQTSSATRGSIMTIPTASSQSDSILLGAAHQNSQTSYSDQASYSDQISNSDQTQSAESFNTFESATTHVSQESDLNHSSLVQRTIHPDETLWSFAKRTTGNALNWQAIAVTNNISNTKTVATGTVLNVPAELAKPGE